MTQCIFPVSNAAELTGIVTACFPDTLLIAERGVVLVFVGEGAQSLDGKLVIFFLASNAPLRLHFLFLIGKTKT